MKVIIAENEEQLNQVMNIRKTVFVEEQNVPPELEIDEYENTSTHFLCYSDDQKPIGAGRFREVDGVGKIERICVLPEARKMGAGKVIMETIIEYAKKQGYKKVKLNAQTHAIPFYEKLGFTVVSEEFLDAGIPHRTMEKQLT